MGFSRLAQDTFAVVGILEEMNDTLRLLEVAAGVTAPTHRVRDDLHNSAQIHHKVAVSAQGRERLAQLTRYDGQLFQHALQIFNQRRETVLNKDLRY